jgi:nucleoside-diphosphate-sugar epimerase
MGISQFVFASTCSSYGTTADRDGYADEDAALRPLSVYADTKVQCEAELLALARCKNLSFTALRLATLYGVSPRMRFDLTVNDFTMQTVLGRELVVFGAHSWRPSIHVVDAARAICSVLEQPYKVSGQVYNVGCTTQNYRKLDIVNFLKAHIPEAKIAYVDRLDDRRDYRVCFRKIARELQFSATRSVPEAIAEIAHLLQTGTIRQPGDPIFRN